VPVIVVAMAGGRVLLVDEDPVVRLAVDRQLDTLGWDAVSVNTGEEAIRVIEMGLFVDVLLTDLRLPDLDGRSVAWTICRLRPFTRIAFMGNGAPGEPLEPHDAPFLLKPFSTTALANALAGAPHVRRSRR
jgi:CheY-like chemotaxis protein